ncbi:MAG: hypothetical protein JWN34_2008 [Bryobacterales bacterium]|nr:hypothetical protein [Bryobacterales bacterium]
MKTKNLLASLILTATMALGQFASIPGPSGSVTSISTSSPITGGPITAAGTIACDTCVVGSLTVGGNPGPVPYVSAAGTLAEDATNFCWDATNHTLGVGNCAPGSTYKINVTGLINASTGYVIGSSAGQIGSNYNAATSMKLIWQNSSSIFAGAPDLSVSRNAAGVLEVGTGAGGVGGDLKRRFDVDTVATIASATTIAPVNRINHITGTTPVATITPPTPFAVAGAGGCIELIPDAAFTTTTGGNIASASTAVVNKMLELCYDAGTTKWYPSY